MGSIATLKNKFEKAFQRKYSFSPALAYRLFGARDKAFFRVLSELGVTDSGLRDVKGNLDQQGLKQRMTIMGVTIKTITQHENPRDNGIVFFKNGNPVAAISQPYIDVRGNIIVKIVEPKYLLKGAA